MVSSDPNHTDDPEPRRNPEADSAERSEARAVRRLQRERSALDPDEERARHSVFDEPAIFPRRPPVLIEHDWYCRNCGYNLRGLMTGHACPECGKIERYEPPRQGEITYARWQSTHRPRTNARQMLLLSFAAVVAGLPLGMVCGLMTVEQSGVINFVLFGPILAEVLKVGPASMLIERRAYSTRRGARISMITIGTAVLFAAGQNIVHLGLLFKGAASAQVVYRWMIGPLLHVICTAVATRGLRATWTRSIAEARQVNVTYAYPYIVSAVILHGAFNAYIFAKGYLGYGF